MDNSIYLISGLGADERIFQHLDFGELKPKFIKWIEPNFNETIESYALRLSVQIDSSKPIILGVSFGGMIAIEIAKKIDYQRIILVSSAQTQQDIPLIYRIFGQLNGHKLIPIKLFKYPNFLTYWFFGMHTKTEKKLLKNILENTDKVFLKWAIDAIIRWKNEVKIDKLIHFHGESDRILPISNKNKIDLIVPQGGHLMIFNKAQTINKALAGYLKSKL